MARLQGKQVHVVAAGFTGNLSPSDDTVQKALVTVDGLAIGGPLSVDTGINGLINPENAVVSFVDATRTFQIAPTGADYSFYSYGVKFTKTGADSIVIPDVEGDHFIFFDASGVLQQISTFSDDLIEENCWLFSGYWDAVNNKQIWWGREHKHTPRMGTRTHARIHYKDGFALTEGGGLANMSVNGSGDVDADAQFSNEASVAFDEDARFDLASRLATVTLPVYRREGTEASNTWRVEESDSFPVLTTGSGRAAYNELTGGNRVQTEVPNNDFVLAHIALTTDEDRPYVAFQGQEVYSNASSARAGALVEVNNLILSGLPALEFRFVATIIFQTSNGNSNAVKSRVRSTDSGDDYGHIGTLSEQRHRYHRSI